MSILCVDDADGDEFWLEYVGLGPEDASMVRVRKEGDTYEVVEATGSGSWSIQAADTDFVVAHTGDSGRVCVNFAKSFQQKELEWVPLAIDMQPDGSSLLIGGRDGRAGVLQGYPSAPSLLEGHMSDVTCCKYFPSGRVALTGSLDMSLRIWGAETGHCGAILCGHRAGVLGCGILDRGHNVVSCSKDGHMRLWESRTASTVSSWELLGAGEDLDVISSTSVALAVGPSGLTTSAGMHLSGGVALVDVRERDRVMWVQGAAGKPWTSCRAMGDAAVLAGTPTGRIAVWDVRMMEAQSPVWEASVGEAGVLRVAAGGDRVWATTERGSVLGWIPRHSEPAATPIMTYQLCGPVLEPAQGLCVPDGEQCITGSNDKVLRWYRL